MRRSFLLILLYPLLSQNVALADDIEVYLYGGATQSAFVQVVMDLGNSDLDAQVCVYGVDCEPPFMTEEAYHHLGEMYVEGESVTAPGVFRAVLAAVVQNPLLDDFYLSLLISNHQDNPSDHPDSGVGGGTVLLGYRKLQKHRAEVIAMLKAVPILASGTTHELQPSETYFEWLRYIRGGDVALGQNTRGNFGALEPLPNYDAKIIADGNYLMPFAEQQVCPKLYSILFTLGTSSRDDDLNADIFAELPELNQTLFTQVLAYLHNSNTDLLPQVDAIVPLQKTWVVTSRGRPGKAAEYAVAGGSGAPFYVDDPVQLQARLTAALLKEMTRGGRSLDAAFSGDTFNQGEALDALFIPLFAPQPNTYWPGNLKKLKLSSTQTDDIDIGEGSFDQVIDTRGLPAFELLGEDKGQIRFDALTFWTDVATLPPGDGEAIPEDADGPIVSRGGAGQKIDGFVNYSIAQDEFVHYFIGDTNADLPVDGYGPRQLYYEPASGRDFAPLDANATTVAALAPLLDPAGTLTDDALRDLIKWARGQDVDNGTSSARSWIMGAVMHSRPFALNYGATPGYSEENPNIRLLFGSVDGLFHIVKNTDSGGRESGREVFGFYPEESLRAIQWQRDGTATELPRYYGVDGTPVVLRVDTDADGTIDAAAGDEAYVYFGLRRGGSSYFALDVSNPDVVPTLLWKISRTVDGVFDELGLTFSTPVVGKVNYSGVPVDVLIFAGGYHGGWNEKYTQRRGKDLAADDDSAGNAIYIVNARTGELVWKAVRGETGVRSNTRYLHAGMVDSMPSAVSALVTPAGIIHRLYVGDSGGAVWRVDLPPNPGDDEMHRRDHWFVTKLADLGFDAGESGGTVSDDRRFFHAPDIVQSYDAGGEFDGVLIQSGNRADPNETVVENGLFYIKDRDIVSGSAVVQAENEVDNPPGRYQMVDLLDQTTCVTGSEQAVVGEDVVACADRSTDTGWRVRFTRTGEKGLSTPLTDGGRVFASTFIPGDANPCSQRRGHGSLYILRLRNATAVANSIRSYELGDGIPAAAVPIGDAIFLPGGGIDLHDLDLGGVRDTIQFLPSEAGKLYRTHWREPGIDPL